MELHLATALGAMKIIKDAAEKNPTTLGLQQTELNKLTTDVPWVKEDAIAVRRMLDAAINGTCDLQGIPAFEMCAEWVAATIYVFVSPTNVRAACYHAQKTGSAEAMMENVGSELISARKLAVLVAQIYANEKESEFAGRFRKAVAKKVREAS